MTATKPGIPDLRKAAAKLGACVEDDSAGVWRVFQVMAPAGKTWACDPGLHMIRVQWRAIDAGMAKSSAIGDAVKRIEFGLEDCPIHDCDYCQGE